jgi:ribonuclease P protein component
MTCPSFAAFYLPSPVEQTHPRFGFTTSRALGKAVVRNRIRRRIREAVRHEQHRFPADANIVFNPRKLVLEIPFEALRQDVVKLAVRCLGRKSS